MKKKIILLKKIAIIFILLTNLVLANEKLVTIATVNNKSITNVDIYNEVQIIKILNKLGDSASLNQIALTNLINEILQQEEINKYKIHIDDNSYKKKKIELENYLINESQNVEDYLKELIYAKIKIESEWNIFISKKYSWNLSINLNEIDEEIKKNEKKFNSQDEITKYRDKLIISEKNKKFQVYSVSHLSNLKRQALIKIF